MTPETLKQFESMHYRRTLLEALAQLSCQLGGASEGLAAVQQLVRPSQQFSAALRERLVKEIHFYEPQDERVLQEKMTALNAGIEKACSLFFRIAKLNDDAFIRNFQGSAEQKEKFKLLQEKLNSFQKQTQHYLAMRIVLQERGTQLESVRLIINQELLNQDFLAEELEGLRSREKVHKKRFRNEVNSMLSDTELLITVAKGNDDVLQILTQNAEQLRYALTILDTGGDMQLLPDLVENICCDILPEGFVDHSEPLLEPVTETKNMDSDEKFVVIANKKLKANNFFTRINIWISTSWNVTWAETKYYRR